MPSELWKVQALSGMPSRGIHEINAGQTTDIPDPAEISWAEVKKGMSKVQIRVSKGHYSQA